MLKLLAKLFGAKDPAPAAEAPYKVETPAAPEPAKCGCGRSQTGFCVGLHKLTPEQWATHADNPHKIADKAVEAMVKSVKQPKKKAPAAPKKVDKDASVKKARKPRQPKKAD